MARILSPREVAEMIVSSRRQEARVKSAGRPGTAKNARTHETPRAAKPAGEGQANARPQLAKRQQPGT